MPVRASDVKISVDLVARLVAEQHPDLQGEVDFVAHGWDSDIFRLGTAFAVRLPRRSEAVELIENEQRWLVHIATKLPVAVPAAVAVGRPGHGYPWPWSIVPWYEGLSGDLCEPLVRDHCAVSLARALIALHAHAPDDAPFNSYRGNPLQNHDDRVRGIVSHIGLETESVVSRWANAVAADPLASRIWVHGDVHPANVVLDPTGNLVAIIDFGELSGGDPAVDLAAAWLFFTPRGRADFTEVLDREGNYDPEVWRRAEGWAIAFAVELIAESDGSQRMTSLGRKGLEALGFGGVTSPGSGNGRDFLGGKG